MPNTEKPELRGLVLVEVWIGICAVVWFSSAFWHLPRDVVDMLVFFPPEAPEPANKIFDPVAKLYSTADHFRIHLLVLGLLNTLAAIGLMQRWNWARILTIIAAASQALVFALDYFFFDAWAAGWAGVGSTYWQRVTWWELLLPGGYRGAYLAVAACNIAAGTYLLRTTVSSAFQTYSANQPVVGQPDDE